jgi:hypothetical protein
MPPPDPHRRQESHFLDDLACGATALLSPRSDDADSFIAIQFGGDIVAAGASAFAYGAAGVAAGLPLAAAGSILIGYGIADAC